MAWTWNSVATSIGLPDYIGLWNQRGKLLEAGLNSKQEDLGWVQPERFGAKGNGVSDDTDAVLKADAAGIVLAFKPGKTYKLSGDIAPKAGNEWVGGGKRQYAVKLKAADSTYRLIPSDTFKWRGFYVLGSSGVSPYVGTAFQIGKTDFVSDVVSEDIYFVNFQTACRMGASLWGTFRNVWFATGQVGVDYDAISAAHYSTTSTFDDCVAIGNERGGYAATYVPVPNRSIKIIGGSVESNDSLVPGTYPQMSFTNVSKLTLDTHVEGSASTVALKGDGISYGDIELYCQGSSYGIQDSTASMSRTTVHNSRFVGTTTKCIDAPEAAGSRNSLLSNEYDQPNTITNWVDLTP